MSRMKEYQQQKLKGARLITQKIMEIAGEADIDINRIEWDGGTLIIDREDFHTLKIFAKNKSIQEKFHAGELADFTPNYGDTIRKIRDVIRDLKSSVMDNDVDEMVSKKSSLRFAQIAVDMGLLAIEQVLHALAEQRRDDRSNERHRLIGEICLEKGWMSLKQIESVLIELSKYKKRRKIKKS